MGDTESRRPPEHGGSHDRAPNEFVTLTASERNVWVYGTVRASI